MNIRYTIDSLLVGHDKIRDSIAPKTVVVKGTFNDEMAEKFDKEMAEAGQTGQSVIPVVIDSYGGQAYSLLHMLDTIKSSMAPVATIVKGKAMSCGQILAAAGTRGYRFVGPDSTVLLHEMSVGDWGKITEVKASSDWAKKLNDRVFAMLDSWAQREAGYFWGLVHAAGHADIHMTADEAVFHGLADAVGLPEWKVDLTVSRLLVVPK